MVKAYNIFLSQTCDDGIQATLGYMPKIWGNFSMLLSEVDVFEWPVL